MIQKHSLNLADYIKYRLVRHLLGLILLATGLGKALDVPGFIHVLANFQLLPPLGNVVMAIALPFVELVTGLGLITACYLRAAAYSAVLLHMLLLQLLCCVVYNLIIVVVLGCFSHVP